MQDTASPITRRRDPDNLPPVLGVPMPARTSAELTGLVAAALDGGPPMVVLGHNLHSVHLWHRDPKFRELYRHAVTHVDGMPLIMAARLRGLAYERDHRTTHVDWVLPLLAELNARKGRLFFLGSRPGVGDKAADWVRAHYPGITMATHHGFFDAGRDSADSLRIIAEINDFKPDYLFVGMGMPRQEHWILDHLDRLDSKLVLACGAVFDYLTGQVRTPPRWMGRAGLEWLYRLVDEPGRLAHRYLVEPWTLLPHFAKDTITGLKSRTRSSTGGVSPADRV